jgi:hypothetical protein
VFTDFHSVTFDMSGLKQVLQNGAVSTGGHSATRASASPQLNPSSQPLTTVIAYTSGLFGGVESGGAAQGIASVIRIG